VVDEVGMHEEIDFPLGKIALCAEEAAVEGLRAGTADSRDEGVPIVGLERTNLDALSRAQRLDLRIRRCIGHGQISGYLRAPSSVSTACMTGA
jgi:hypothetical protein